MADALSRRTVLRGLAASAVATGSAAVSGTSASAAPKKPQPTDWAAFDAAVGAAFDQLNNVGGAVAVVSADAVLHTRTFGVRSLTGRKPVTPDTHFLVASTTKSMTAELVATYVDQGVLWWDQRVVTAYPAFRAPTPALTESLRVRDLLGMATGIEAPPAMDFHQGDPTAEQLLQSLVNLPVAHPPNTSFFYNNTVYAVGGYLPLLATGVAPRDLTAAYANAMRDRLWRPAGMTSTVAADDPRGVVDDYGTGCGFDLRARPVELPYGPVGSYAPVGCALSTVTDMAAYVRLQLRRGRSVTGGQVVSEANLAECWKPHITQSTPGLPVAVQYALGWSVIDYPDGTRLVTHSGGIDGFTSYIAFLPQHDLGVVVLTNMNPTPTGLQWSGQVLNLLAARQLGLDLSTGLNPMAQGAAAMAGLVELGDRTRKVDAKAVDPYLGYYEAGWSLTLHGRDLSLRLGPRVFALLALADGTYMATQGILQGTHVTLAREADGTPHLEIDGAETVRRTTG
ncbi:MAG: serine hydrolase domain-containing protein [Lapillicoccus sp.]